MDNIQVKLELKSTDRMALPMHHSQAIRVDLGCGGRKRNDFQPFIGIDAAQYPGVDIIRDVEKQGMPFGDCTIDFIYSSHFMEHVGNLIFVIEEVWRVLKKKGTLELICPKFDTGYAFANPDHKRLIHPQLWEYWCVRDDMDKKAYGIKARFTMIKNFHSGEGLFTTMIAEKE